MSEVAQETGALQGPPMPPAISVLSRPTCAPPGQVYHDHDDTQANVACNYRYEIQEFFHLYI